jgi:hypothetical protein
MPLPKKTKKPLVRSLAQRVSEARMIARNTSMSVNQRNAMLKLVRSVHGDAKKMEGAYQRVRSAVARVGGVEYRWESAQTSRLTEQLGKKK